MLEVFVFCVQRTQNNQRQLALADPESPGSRGPAPTPHSHQIEVELRTSPEQANFLIRGCGYLVVELWPTETEVGTSPPTLSWIRAHRIEKCVDSKWSLKRELLPKQTVAVREQIAF